MGRKAEAPPSPELWISHEHVAPPVELQAKKLLLAAGNSEIAKHAIDVASGGDSDQAIKSDLLAESIGFRSYRALVESSTPGPKVEERQWYVTPISTGKCIIWNDRDYEVVGAYPSMNEALDATF